MEIQEKYVETFIAHAALWTGIGGLNGVLL